MSGFRALPSNVRPINYKMTIAPDLEKFTFTGSQEIDIQVLESTKIIEMHCLVLADQTQPQTHNLHVSDDNYILTLDPYFFLFQPKSCFQNLLIFPLF